MLAIGSSVFRSRLQSTWPVEATAMAAALACTPLGPAFGWVVVAAAGRAATVSATPAASTAAPAHLDTRTARIAMSTPVTELPDNNRKLPSFRRRGQTPRECRGLNQWMWHRTGKNR